MPYKDPAKQRAAQAASYQRNKPEVLAQQRTRREVLREWLDNSKLGKACTDCGQSYPPYVMDYDHMPEYDKLAKLSAFGTLGSIAALEREVAKCELVCSNCHRIRTWQRAQG